MLLAFCYCDIKIPASGDYDQKLEAGKSVQLDVDGDSIFLLHNYYINPRISNKIVEGDNIEINTSHYFFHQTGRVILESAQDCYAHFSIYNIHAYNCDEIVMSTKTRFYYEITDTIYTNGRPQFSFKNNSKVCFFTTTPHTLNYTISVNSGPTIDGYLLNGTTLNFSHSSFIERSVFISWHSNPSNHFTLTAIPQTPDGNKYMGDLFYYSQEQLYRGIRVYTAGNYEYNGTYPMTISTGRPGYVVMHNAQGGGFISDVHAVTFGPKSLYFAFIPQDDISMCQNLEFSLGNYEYNSKSGNTQDNCLIAATPHTVLYTLKSDANIDTYYQGDKIDIAQFRKSPIVFHYGPNVEISVKPTILAPQGFGDFFKGVAVFSRNQFSYPSVETGVQITAYNGDYIVYMANLDTYRIICPKDSYFVMETCKLVQVNVSTASQNYGSLDQSYIHGVHFQDEPGEITISASYFCIFTYSIINLGTFQRKCHNIYIQTGNSLQFIAAVPKSKYGPESNVTLDTEMDLCAWMLTPSGIANYSVSTYYLAPDKSYAEIYPLNNISGFSRVLKYSGQAYHESNVIAKSVLLYYHNELDTYYEEYIRVTSNQIQHITNITTAQLAFKKSGNIRYVVPSSMGTSLTVDSKDKLSKSSIIIMVGVLCALMIIFGIIGVAMWIAKKRKGQVMNSQTANSGGVTSRYGPEGAPRQVLEEIEFSTSDSMNNKMYPKAEPYNLDNGVNDNPYNDVDL